MTITLKSKIPQNRIDAAGGNIEAAEFIYMLEQAGLAEFGTRPSELPPDVVVWTSKAVEQARLARSTTSSVA